MFSTRKFLIPLTLFLGLLGLLLWSTLAAAATTTTHTIYVSSPADQKILKVVVTVNEDLDPPSVTSLSVSKVFPKKKKDGRNFEWMTFGPDPDYNLWVVSGNEILKVDPDDGSSETCYVFPTGEDPTTPGDIRFLANVPYFTAKGSDGVWRFTDTSCTSLEQVVSQSPLGEPGGTFFEITGRLLFIDSTTSGKFFRKAPPFDACPSCTAAEEITPLSGLNSPVAVGTRGSHGFGSLEVPNTDTMYLSTSGAIQVLTCPSSGSCTTNSPILFGSDSPRDFVFNLAGQAFVATLDVTQPKPVAKLWRVDPGQGNEKTLLVNFDDEKGKTAIHDIWGVAIPPTSLSVTQTFTGESIVTERFNCGNSLVDLSLDLVGSVDATIDCQLVLPEEVEFGGDLTEETSCASYDWNNGFCTLMDVELADETILDDSLLVTYVRKAEPLDADPLIVKQDPSGIFSEVTIVDYYLLGELDPEDGSRRDKKRGVIVVADEDIEGAALFDAFRPHLGVSCTNPEIVQGGGGLPIRVDFNQDCDPDQELRLSVRCEAADPPPVFQDIDVTSEGNANVENLFRCDVSGGWVYNLDLVGSNVPFDSCCAVSVWGDVGAAAQGFFKRQE